MTPKRALDLINAARATNDRRYVLMYGNPVEGFKVIGPFDDVAEARNYGDNRLDQGWHYWVLPLGEA